MGIFFGCRPSKVPWSIVPAIVIPMSDLMLWCRSRPMKGHANKSMGGHHSTRRINGDTEISSFMPEWAASKDLAADELRLSGPARRNGSIERSQLAQAAGLVSGISRYRSPLFFVYNRISHVTCVLKWCGQGLTPVCTLAPSPHFAALFT
jgi:hypothetical protein